MASEYIRLGRPFLSLHRRWLTVFFGLEILLLTGAVVVLLTPYELSSMSRHTEPPVWIFAVPAGLLQIVLGIHLGITFSLRNPAAWAMRLPLPKSTATWYSYCLIWGNGFVLFIPMFEVWSRLYELTVYPGAMALVLSPCLAFQVARRARNHAAAIAAALAATCGLSLMIVGGVYVPFLACTELCQFIQYIHYLQPFNINILALALSALLALMADPARKCFRTQSLIIAAMALGILGFSGKTEYDFRQSDYFLRLDTANRSYKDMIPQCEKFKRAADEILTCPDSGCSEEDRIKDQAEALRAITALNAIPGFPLSRQEHLQLWKELPQQSSIALPFDLLEEINGHCNSSLKVYLLLRSLIRGITDMNDLEAAKRHGLMSDIWSFASTNITNSTSSLSNAVINVAILRLFIDAQLLEGISIDEFRSIESELGNARERGRASNVIDSIFYIGCRMPTDRRLRHAIRSYSEAEYSNFERVIDDLSKLASRAKLRVPY